MTPGAATPPTTGRGHEKVPYDPVLCSVFGNRFMGIAEAMGEALRKISISVNIKLRMDFSCALFSPTGDLVANAPHIPVHVGSLTTAVRWQIEHLSRPGGGGIRPGDAILTNSPSAGGTHLPDVTVISPVFDEAGKDILFFVANRGHHADIGGILPGSMPPTSKTIFEEGARVTSFKIVSEGRFDEAGLHRLFVEEPATHPGCSGSRCWSDVLSDVRAQLAANRKGQALLQALIQEWGLDTVQAYMGYIRSNAELAVRNLLKEVARKQGTNELTAHDYMDDGTPIQLKVTIDPDKGEAHFDFAGTGPEVIGNVNAPRAITSSAIIYCLRSMVDLDIPLNAGCLAPVRISVPQGCLLDPSDTAAVVGGNVLTSQRITDVVLKAFGAAAASQGCCNNLTFGLGGKDGDGKVVAGFGYYETIAGGSGAGPTWEGTDGVHTHMTNTRITDPEIMERRYPVVLRRFTLRPDSGGAGLHRGGHGVVREIEFLPEETSVSILSERRAFAPYGMQGGGEGTRGQNLWIKRRRRRDGDLLEGQEEGEANAQRVVNLGGKATARMGPGDRIVIMTPGGGAWGRGAAAGSREGGKEGSARPSESRGGVGGGGGAPLDATKGSVAEMRAQALSV